MRSSPESFFESGCPSCFQPMDPATIVCRFCGYTVRKDAERPHVKILINILKSFLNNNRYTFKSVVQTGDAWVIGFDCFDLGIIAGVCGELKECCSQMGFDILGFRGWAKGTVKIEAVLQNQSAGSRPTLPGARKTLDEVLCQLRAAIEMGMGTLHRFVQAGNAYAIHFSVGAMHDMEAMVGRLAATTRSAGFFIRRMMSIAGCLSLAKRTQSGHRHNSMASNRMSIGSPIK